MKSDSIIFIGRSGCGKGTQSGLLIDYFKNNNNEPLYISTGNEFRSLIEEGDNFTAKKVKAIYDEGGRHPDFLCITILGNFFKNKFSPDKNIIMDGGARSLEEAKTITDIFNFYEIKNPKVFYLDVSHEWSVEKLKNRGRTDDNEKIFEIKKQWFDNEVMPAISFLKNNSYFEFYTINGERSIQDIHNEIMQYLK